MKRRLTTREKVMLGLLAAAGIVAYRMLTGEGIGFGGPAPQEPASRALGEPPRVRMDLLLQEPAPFDDDARNLFAYYVPPAPKPAYVPPPPQVVIPPPPPRDTQPAPPPPPPVPQPPQPRFQYIGYLGPKDGRIAFFETGGDEKVPPARVGDVVAQHYRVLDFKHDAVILGYTDEQWRGRTTELKLAGLD